MDGQTKIKVLVVDDDARLRKLCAAFLQKIGHTTVAVDGAEQALKEARKQKFDLVLTDINMPGMTGDVMIDHLQEIQPEIVPVIMTGYPSMELAIEAVRKGVYEFLTKPFQMNDFQQAIERAINRRRDEVQRVQREFADALLDVEKRLGDDFELPKTVETLMGTDVLDIDVERDADKSAQILAEDQPVPFAAQGGGKGEAAATRSLVTIICEPIPEDRKLLKKSPDYHHFRTIYAAQRALNEVLRKTGSSAEVKFVMANCSTDIPKFFRLFGDQICCIIFGPNFPMLRIVDLTTFPFRGVDS
jgi:FixJ family two-component response regulator